MVEIPNSKSTKKRRLSIIELIYAKGHKNIKSTHNSTFEITKDPSLTEHGDCILAISANKGITDLTDEFKNALLNDDANLKIIIEAGGKKDSALAKGSKLLLLKDINDMVIRKGNFICERTLAINSNKAAIDFDRNLIEILKDPNTEVRIKLIVKYST